MTSLGYELSVTSISKGFLFIILAQVLEYSEYSDYLILIITITIVFLKMSFAIGSIYY